MTEVFDQDQDAPDDADIERLRLVDRSQPRVVDVVIGDPEQEKLLRYDPTRHALTLRPQSLVRYNSQSPEQWIAIVEDDKRERYVGETEVWVLDDRVIDVGGSIRIWLGLEADPIELDLEESGPTPLTVADHIRRASEALGKPSKGDAE